MENTNEAYLENDKKYYLQTFRRFPVTLDYGKGSRVWDVEGNEYIDALGGIAVSVLGHQHPALVEALRLQAEKLIHISNFYLSVPQVELSRKLVQVSGLDRVFLANSGAEAVEGAMKVARKYAHSRGRGGEIISFEGSFHGRTLATIATGKKKMQEGFEPIPAGFRQIPFNTMEAVRATAGRNTAAFLLEPIQGEGGIHEAEPVFLKELRAFCDQHDILLILDEIQCGMGRTGTFFAHEEAGIRPDIVTLAKGLGGGVPIGAFLASEKTAAAMDFGDHGTTFGGNPLAAAAAIAVLDTLEKEHLMEGSAKKGDWLMREIAKIEDRRIREIRGRGLMVGIAFDIETKPLAEKMFEKGVLANATAGNVLRLVPPLVIDYRDLEQVVSVLKESLKEI